MFNKLRTKYVRFKYVLFNRYYRIIALHYVYLDTIRFKKSFDEAVFSKEAVKAAKDMDQSLCQSTGLCTLRSWKDPSGRIVTPREVKLGTNTPIGIADLEREFKLLSACNADTKRSFEESCTIRELTPEEALAAERAIAELNGQEDVVKTIDLMLAKLRATGAVKTAETVAAVIP